MKRLGWVVCVACAATFLIACAEETTSRDRTNVQQPVDAGSEASTSDAGTPDPEDGRDTDPASCYAACSNSTFTCTPGGLVASVTPDSAGCTGTLGPAGSPTTQTLKLDCGAKKVCIEGTCVDGRYNATTFAYTPSSGSQIVCTRE